MADASHALAQAPPRRSAALLALGVRLARGGLLPVLSLGLGALLTLGAVAVAFVMVRQRGAGAPLHDLPGAAATVLGWGAGVLLAFASSAQALRRDLDQGIRALLRARGGSPSAYVAGRVFGLVALVALVVAGGTLVTSGACLALAPRADVGAVVQGSLAAMVYALAFSVTVAPLAMAALGARSRAGGYAWLLVVLVVPEMLERWTTQLLPESWHHVASIPSALASLRIALMPPGSVDVARLGRSVVVLAVVVILALLLVRQQAARLERDGGTA